LEDIEALEARDLLFLRLLQYSAFKQVASSFETLLGAPRRVPRDVPLEPHFAALLPELVWATDAQTLARLAAHALEPHPAPAIPLLHLINPKVSVREQAAHITALLQREKVMTFRAIVRDTREMGVIIARFLALLELFRESLIAFDQVRSLSELTVRWTGGDRGVDLKTDFDEEVHQDA
ncbi:MAG: segregation/condensation protein A, partial [Demequinaceae bacterium]|nr:segregation/condensation protein A [Demequinaceae bacterium]